MSTAGPDITLKNFPLVWGVDAMVGPCEWVLNRLDPDSPNSSLVPLPMDEPWETLQMHVVEECARSILGVFPALTQLQQRLYACSPQGMPALLLPPEQLKALPAFQKQFPIDGIVTTKECVPSLLQELRGAEKPYLQVLHDLEAGVEKISYPRVYLEAHLVPGIVGFFQCKTLAYAPDVRFHASERFTWELAEGKLRVKDTAHGRFDALLPGAFRMEEAACPCGRRSYIPA